MTEQQNNFATRDVLDMVKQSLEQRIQSLQDLLDLRYDMLTTVDAKAHESFHHELLELRAQVKELLEKIQQLEQDMLLALGDDRHPGLLHRVETALESLIESSNERLETVEKEQAKLTNFWAKLVGLCSGLSLVAYAMFKLISVFIFHVKF